VLKFFGVADGVADGMPLRFTQGVIEIDQGVIPKRTIFMVEIRTSRRNKVRNWLLIVQQYRQPFQYDIRTAVTQSQQSFPSNLLLRIFIAVAKDWATKYVRSAIEDAATSLGLTLSDGEFDVLTELAIVGASSSTRLRNELTVRQ
jgi:hypothetical protein